MKKLSYTIVMLAAMLAIPAATLYAQSTGTWFKVPFSFNVGGQTLPPGEYFVEGLFCNAVAFHNGKGEKGLVVIAQQSPRTQEVNAKLIFHRYGDHYFLATAELPNMDYARTFPAGKLESQIAKSEAPPQTVEIARK